MDQQPASPRSEGPCCPFSRCFPRCCCSCITQKSSRTKPKPKPGPDLRHETKQKGSVKVKDTSADPRQHKAEETPSPLLLTAHQTLGDPAAKATPITAAAPEPSMAPELSAESELKRIRDDFVERVSEVVLKQLLDRLVSDDIFNTIEKEAILETNPTRADKASCLIDSVMKKGPKACSKMKEHLLVKDQTLYCHLGLSMPPSAVGGKKSVDFQKTEMKEVKDPDMGRPGFQNKSGHANEAFQKDIPEADEILSSDGKKGFPAGPYRTTETVNNKVDLKKHAPPKASLFTQTSEDEGFQREFLEAHNAYRKMHQAPPLVLNSELCAEAQRWAEHLLEMNRLEPSSSDNGENTYHMYSSKSFKPTGREAVDSWYSEVQHYDFSRPGFQKKTGSFTQVVWKGSKELGVGFASDGKRAFIVGHYRPAGNFTNEGYFEQNVLPKASTTPKISADEMFKKEFLDAHNTFRVMHRAPPLVLNPEMCAAAQKFADRLLELNKLDRSGAEDGENTYCMSSSKFFEITGREAVDHWYSNIKDYDFSRPGYQKKTGSFTQLVWKDSKEVGVGMASSGKKAFVVGHYRPAGNINSEELFRKNVLPKGRSLLEYDG